MTMKIIAMEMFLQDQKLPTKQPSGHQRKAL